MTLLAQAADLQTVVPRGIGPWDWARAALILVLGVLVSRVIERILMKSIQKRGPDSLSGRLVGRLVGYFLVLAGFIYALSSLNVQIAPLLGALGIGGLAIAIAMQHTLENFISGIFLETRRPFRRGDQIFTNDYEGVVEDVNLRATMLRTFDGRRVIVPNGAVLNNAIVNYTALGSRRTTLNVGVAYDTDLDVAKQIIEEATASVDDVMDPPRPRAFVEEFADSSINFAVHFWHAPQKKSVWETRDKVAIAIKKALDAAEIVIPFPQRRLSIADNPES